MNSQSPSKYDMRLNPVYQVDWQNAASGKRLSATKRRVVWRFGFSNAEAITQGSTGAHCRGEEHEISVVWSLTSGKRLVTADGQEVHFSFGKRTDTKFETSWTMSGGHILKVINHATPPLLQIPGFRQFDLLLDGCSFFDMPKIYELGTPKANKLAMARVRKSPAAAYNNYSVPISPAYDQESYGRSKGDDYYRAPTTPVRQSARAIEHQHQFATPAPSTRSAPIDMISETTPSNYVEDYFDAPPTFTLQAHADEFTPAPAQPPSFQAKSSHILSAYTPQANTAVLALANESHTYMQQPQQPYQQQQMQQQQQPRQQQMQQQQEPHQQQHAYHQTYSQALVPVSPDRSDSSMRSSSPQVITPTMAPLSMEELESRDGPLMSDMEKALKALVNFDDISETIVTPERRKAEEKKMQLKPKKSKPLPPTAPEWHLGSKAALGDIKKFTPPKAPAKEIMITHAFDPAAVQAGMLVVYGSTIPQAQGFGYGYQQQQQQQQMARYSYMQQQQGQMASAA
jgi:hypothetical protein